MSSWRKCSVLEHMNETKFPRKHRTFIITTVWIHQKFYSSSHSQTHSFRRYAWRESFKGKTECSTTRTELVHGLMQKIGSRLHHLMIHSLPSLIDVSEGEGGIYKWREWEKVRLHKNQRQYWLCLRVSFSSKVNLTELLLQARHRKENTQSLTFHFTQSLTLIEWVSRWIMIDEKKRRDRYTRHEKLTGKRTERERGDKKYSTYLLQDEKWCN